MTQLLLSGLVFAVVIGMYLYYWYNERNGRGGDG